MQLKKMRKVLPMLYARQANKGHHSPLTASLKQASVEKANLTKTNSENSSFGYEKNEETRLHQIRCIKCRCVLGTSVLELLKHKYQAGEGSHYVCRKCQLGMPYVLRSLIDPIIASEKKEKSPIRNFKAKNFQPGKYYCDKCRFTTRDPLQHKKHMVRHEKIRFICSQCNCSFYTKGAFQRHLVKHTGQFPYQCNYCEYGAIRHDYIVKHTKRLHETVSDKEVMFTVAKGEQKLCLPKQNLVQKGIVQGAPLQNKSACLSLNGNTCETQDKMTQSVHSFNVAECSQDLACIEDTTTFNLPDASIIKAEVFSPKKGPLLPGMPLTVVAPPSFVVPSNCFAKIVEISEISGTQQLILKFIPLKEITSSTKNYKEAEFGDQCVKQGKKMNETTLPTFEDSCILVNDYHKNVKCPISSSSTVLKCNSMSAHNDNICKTSTEKEYDCVLPRGEISSEEINYPECIPKGNYQNNQHIKYDLCTSLSIASSSSEARNEFQNGPLDAVQETNIPSFCDKMCLSNAGKEYLNEFRVDTKSHLFDSSLFYPSEKESQWNTSASLDGSNNILGEVNRENMEKREYKHMGFPEAQIANEGDFLEVPVISSPHDTSAVNVPEGIKWTDTSHKSTSLLRKKIARLICAVESNRKSQLRASFRHDKSKVFKKVRSSQEKQCEGNDSATKFVEEFVPYPKRDNDSTSFNELSNKQEQELPCEMLTQTIMKNKTTSKTHTDSPVFIPYGTLLRVLKEKKKEGLSSPSMFLPRPVPCCSSATFDKLLSLPAGNKMNEASGNQRISHSGKIKRDPVVNSSSQHNSVSPHSQGSNLGRPKKRVMIEEAQNKDKQLYDKDSLSKKRPRTKNDCFFNVVPTLKRHFRLKPFKSDQLIKCPHRNQPIVVLNHPDVDSPEIINIMRVINKYKGSVIKAVLSERIISNLDVKRHH